MQNIPFLLFAVVFVFSPRFNVRIVHRLMRLLIIENRRHISIIITNDDDETYRKTTGELGMIDENKLFFSFIDRQRCATREAFFTIFRKKKNSTHIRYLCIVQMAKPIKKTSICVEIHLSK